MSGGLLSYRHKPKYQVEEVKCFVVPRAHRRTAVDDCHHDTSHQGRKRTESLISDSGGLESTRMLTAWSRTVDSVSFMKEGQGPSGPNDGYCPPPTSSSQLDLV